MIMEKVNKPKGLIRYASEFTIRTGKRLRWTPRMIAYTAILFVLIALESFLLTTRTDIDVTMVRTRGVLFNTELDGRISNLYNIKLINKTTDDMNISIVPEDPTIEIKLIGHEWKVKADSLLDGELFVIVPADHMANQKQKIEIQIWSNGHLITEEKTTFIGPAGKAHH
jgi:polyferredoxin